MKKTVLLVSLLASLTLGCAGKTPNPIPQYQPGDEQRTCEMIKLEIADNEASIMKLVPQQNKTGKNVALGVAGAVFLVPLFFMDFSDAERIEVEAYQRRNNYLRVLANQKDCGIIPQKVKIQTTASS